MAVAESVLNTQQQLLMEGWSKEQILLHQLIRQEGTKVGDVARAVGRSHSAISQYISGKYSSAEALDPIIKDYLIDVGYWQEETFNRVETESKSHISKVTQIGVIETLDLNRVLGVCRLCYENREMGMIVGKPGTGKTFAFMQFGQANIPYALITCDETTSKKSILVDLAESLDLVTKGASSTLLRKIVKHLTSYPRLLIFDEADLLRGPAVFETIRAIYDKAGTCGVVLCGNNNLAERILIYAEDRPELARVRDRIGYFKELTGLSTDEASQFLSGVNCTPEARRILMDIARQRGIRQLMKALGRLLDETNGSRITSDLVEELGQIVLSFNA